MVSVLVAWPDALLRAILLTSDDSARVQVVGTAAAQDQRDCALRGRLPLQSQRLATLRSNARFWDDERIGVLRERDKRRREERKDCAEVHRVLWKDCGNCAKQVVNGLDV